MVFANAYVFTRIVYGAALANQNIARFGNLSSEKFYAQVVCFRIRDRSWSYRLLSCVPSLF